MPVTLAPEQLIIKPPEGATPPKENPFKAALNKARQPLSQKTQDLIAQVKQRMARNPTKPGERMEAIASDQPETPATPQETPVEKPKEEEKEKSVEGLSAYEQLEQLSENGKIETQEKPAILDPQTEYQKALAEVQAERAEDPFVMLRKHMGQENPPATSLERTRVFTPQDRARHKALELRARTMGVKDIEGFNRLVEYFESTMTQPETSYVTYKADISQNEKDRVAVEWYTKGYSSASFKEPKNGKMQLQLTREVPYNIEISNAVGFKSESIPVLKAILETGIDPIPVLEALGSLVSLGPAFLNANRIGVDSTTYTSDTESFLQLLKDPNLPVMLPVIKNMARLPHEYWGLYRLGEGKTQIDMLRDLARQRDVSIYSEDFFEKAGIIAKALGRNVSIEQLPNYHELINNPDRIAFLAIGIERGIIPRPRFDYGRDDTFNIFDSLKILERDNLLGPLTTLLHAGVKIDRPIFGPDKEIPGYSSVYGYRPDTITNNTNDALRQFIREPAVQTLLQDQDRQAFTQALRKIQGDDISSTLAEELYPIRQELVTVNNLLFSTLDGQYEGPGTYGEKKLTHLKTLLQSEERRQILVSPQFQEFVATLQQEGTTIKHGDYFYEQKQDMFDGTEHPRQEILLVQLFKARDIANLIDPDLVKKILRPDRYGANQYEGIDQLKSILQYRDTIRMLRDAGVELDPENFQDNKWISTIRHNLFFMHPNYLQAVPQERKSEWIRAAVKLPRQLQYGLIGRGKFIEEGPSNYVPKITAEAIDRVSKLASIVSSSEFFPQEFQYDSFKLPEVYATIGEYKGDLDAIFTNGNPNAEFAKLLVQAKMPHGLSLVLKPEMLDSFTGDAQNTLRAWLEFPENLQIRAVGESMFPNFSPEFADRYRVVGDIMHIAKIDSISENLIDFVKYTENHQHLLVDGNLSRMFIDAVRERSPQDLQKFLTQDVLPQYDGSERSVVETWLVLPDDLQQEVIKEAPDFPTVSPDQAEKYRVAAETITRIRNSPSAEIKRLEKELIGQLWKLDNPTQALDEIIGVFEKNNLPLVGKVYRVFETIYDNPNASGKTTLERDLAEKSYLSPVLRTATPQERREIIYRDLLSVNIHSGNPQLRDYLEVIRDGEQVVTKMEQEGASMLSQREQQQLGHFFDKMDMLYTTSLFGRTIEARRRARKIDSSPATAHLPLQERLDALRKNFRIRGDQRLSDRLSEMFLRPVGFTSIEDALEEMDRSKVQADSRNRQFVQGGDGKIVLKPGDRFKGVNSRDIGKILERGAVAGEYLGASAGSDFTPYDTDTAIIPETDLKNGTKGAIAATASNGYGNLLLVIRERGQFGGEPEQYESFASGTVGDTHYGIRTGFPSTEIDAIIAKDSSRSQSLDDLFVAIAQNGVYIPVGNTNGEIIFTQAQFEEYRKTFDGVSEYSPTPVSVKRVGIDADTSFPTNQEVVINTRRTLDQLMGEIKTDRGRVINLSDEIRRRIGNTLAASGVTLRGEFDTGIYGAELVDTGSTARGSNLPGDYDFDLSLQLDPNDSKRLTEVVQVVKGVLKLQEDKSHAEADYIQVRGMGSQIIEGQTLDIDIGVGKRSDEGVFASSDAIAQKLESIRATYGDEAYYDSLANIVLAKKILKEGHAYKKLEHGGMGGIGVENWILLNNGNVLDAFQSFWQAAHDESGNVVPYEEFANKYKIFDAGINIKYNSHDNFVRVLKENGYRAMLQTIGEYLQVAPQTSEVAA